MLGALLILSGCAGFITPPKLKNEVLVVSNIQYYEGPGASPQMHALDLYIPKSGHKFPVVIFVHGGAWTFGDKGNLANVGYGLAEKGYLAVLVNYRLSPAVQHPAHITDIARAVSWTFRNIRRYGGDPDLIFLGGHSAGAHLVSLLALDEKYLYEQNFPLAKIKGIICISGLYKLDLTRKYDSIFTSNPKERQDASPISHLTKRPPPFLILYAAREMPMLDEQAEDFAARIHELGGAADLKQIPETNHQTIISWFGHNNDQTSLAVFRFLEEILRE